MAISRPILTPADEQLAIEAQRALLQLRVRAWTFASGVVVGLLLSVATLVLVLRGGETVGPHLGLLAVYLPGYSVSVVGSMVGFAWGAAIGAALGWLAARLYNLFARRR